MTCPYGLDGVACSPVPSKLWEFVAHWPVAQSAVRAYKPPPSRPLTTWSWRGWTSVVTVEWINYQQLSRERGEHLVVKKPMKSRAKRKMLRSQSPFGDSSFRAFVGGMTVLLDIGATSYQAYDMSQDDAAADYEALKSDWLVVGGELMAAADALRSK